MNRCGCNARVEIELNSSRCCAGVPFGSVEELAASLKTVAASAASLRRACHFRESWTSAK